MLAPGLPPLPPALCLPCLLSQEADAPKAASGRECWSWCFPPRRQPRKQRIAELAAWRRAWPAGGGPGRLRRSPLAQDVRLPCGLLPSQVSELLDRDITPEDYEMLLQLDEAVERPTADRAVVEGLAAAPAGDFLGASCAVCLLPFEPKDGVAVLRCGHQFHTDCISKWLSAWSRWCPLCGSEALPPAA